MRTGSTTIVAVATLAVTVAGCSATTAGTPSSTTSVSAAPASASATASGSSSASGSRRAWVRGTKVTLTNGTAAAVEVKPYTYSGDDNTSAGSYASLAAGASTSAAAPWSSTSSTSTTFYVKRPSGGVVALLVQNPSAGTPWTKTCESSSLTGCDSEDNFRKNLTYDENQTQSTTTADGAATFTVTRNGDGEDQKNWTVSLDAVS